MYLTHQPIFINDFVSSGSAEHRAGASVLFTGIVRNHSEGKQVLCLEYEAYEEMADKILSELVARALKQWPLEEIRLLHRLGRVNLGEAAVVIEVQSAHRDEAYQASRFLIEEIKHRVPIWKKEYFADGTSEWSRCKEDHRQETIDHSLVEESC